MTRPAPRPATPADGVAWITGASSGIGRAVALAHARDGWTVAATARRAEELTELARDSERLPGRIVAHVCDVTDAAAMASTAAAIETAHGPVARAVFNAGVYLPMRARELDPALYRKSFDINVMGVVHGLAGVLPGMIERSAGQVAITASVAGYGGLPLASAYGATKAALINLAAGLKFDLDNDGVLIQVLCPGFVETPATASNPFPMPFLISPETAAERILAGLATTRFEVAFPRRFALLLKLANTMPYGLYFKAVARATGWSAKTD